MAAFFAEVDLSESTRLVAFLKEPTFVVLNKSRTATESFAFFPELAVGARCLTELFGKDHWARC